MNEKCTIGDLAKEAGISTKAIRIYEKKGLIKPTAYSEGNYRLYDNNAKITLQKIITFKFIGFSLDEIAILLEQDKNNDILKSLSYQKQLLELKRSKIDKVIYCIDQAARRCAGGEMDWKSFADIMSAVIIDRNADEGYWAALYNAPQCQDTKYDFVS
jgi:DNA-binding transcriptional MerR regulator